MAKAQVTQKRTRPGTKVTQRAAAARRAAPRPQAIEHARPAEPNHDSVFGELGHLFGELLSLLIVAAELGAIFGVSWAAGWYAEYLKANHMAPWKVTVFEAVDDVLLGVDVLLFVAYVGRKAFLTLKRTFK